MVLEMAIAICDITGNYKQSQHKKNTTKHKYLWCQSKYGKTWLKKDLVDTIASTTSIGNVMQPSLKLPSIPRPQNY